MLWRNCICLRAVSILGICGSAASAATIYVDDTASGPSTDGTSWCDAFRDLQDGLAVAQAGDEVRVAAGLYRPDRGSGDRTATFMMKSGVVLMGGFAGCRAADPSARDTALFASVLSGDLGGNDGPDFANYADNSFHVVTYSDPAGFGAVLDGFTVRGGHADGTGPAALTTNQGGGVHIRNGTAKCMPGGPTLRNCIFLDNKQYHHGAVNDHGLSTVIENCTFRNNRSGEQGGGLQIHSGAPRITDCLFENNESGGNFQVAGQGGGAWMGADSDPTCAGPARPLFERCVFSNNRSLFLGGAVFYTLNEPTFRDCEFVGNSAVDQGGGTFGNRTSHPTFERCVWDGNTAPEAGGLWHFGANSRITISDCVFRNNHATVFDGGMYIYGGAPHITNTLFENNLCDLTGGGAALQQDFFIEACQPEFCPQVFEDCTFRGNVANQGGGLAAFYTSRPVLRRVLFEENHALTYGGGMYMNGTGTPVPPDHVPPSSNGFLDGCVFRRNIGDSVAGGLYATQGASLTIARSDFLENTDSSGAGAYVSDNTLLTVVNSRFLGNRSLPSGNGAALTIYSDVEALIANTLFSGNVSGYSGGAVFVADGSAVTVINSTFTNNMTTTVAGAMAVLDSNVQLMNSIVWDNVQSGTSGPLVPNSGGSLTVSYCTVEGGWSGEGNSAADPLLVGALGPDGVAGTEDDDASLSWDSPALNVAASVLLPADMTDLDGDGDVTEPLPLDLNGEARMYGPGLDMGATELGPVQCEPGTFSATGAPPCTSCSPGFAQPSAGATECLSCAPGTVAASAGSAMCTACPTGTYQPSSGATSCLSCGCADADPCTTNGCDAVSGTCEYPPIAGCSVPTLSSWGLAVTALLLAIAGTMIAEGRRGALHSG